MSAERCGQLTVYTHTWGTEHRLSMMFRGISGKSRWRWPSRCTGHTGRMPIRWPHDRISAGQRAVVSGHHGSGNGRAGAAKVTVEIGLWGHGCRGCCGRLEARHGCWGVKTRLIEIRIVHFVWKRKYTIFQDMLQTKSTKYIYKTDSYAITIYSSYTPDLAFLNANKHWWIFFANKNVRV